MPAADHHVQRGNEAIAVGDYRTAIAEFDTASQLDATDAEAHFGRGLAFYQLGDNASAVQDLTRTLQLRPDHPGVAAVHAMRALARANLGDRAGAMADHQAAVLRDPDMNEFFRSQTCVGTAQIVVLAQMYPARLSEIITLLTRSF